MWNTPRVATVSIAVLLCLTLATAASAGPIQPKEVPADAKFVVHVDVSKGLDTRLGRFILDHAKAKGLGDKVDQFEQMTGVNLLTDIKGVTVYGKAYAEKSAVLLIRGTFDQQKLTQLLEAGDTYEAIKHGDYTIHRWVDEKAAAKDKHAERYGVFHGDGLIVMAGSLEPVKAALLVLDGHQKNATANEALHDAIAPAGGTVATLAAFDIEVPEHKRNAVIDKVKDVRLSIGEAENTLTLSATVTAIEAEQAEQMADSLRGLKAMVLLSAQRRQDNGNAKFPPEALDLLRAVNIAQEGASVTVSADWSTDTVIKLAETMIRMHELKEGEQD
jgi:hypothetical protein